MFFIKLLSALALIYLVICLFVFFTQSRLVYFPTKRLYGCPDDYGMQYEEIWLKVNDNLELQSWWLPVENAAGTILVCHGNAGNISHRLIIAKAFQSFGFNVFLFDYRGYGNNKGKPTEEGTYLDAEAAYSFLTNLKRIDPKSIFVYGESLGAAVAIELAINKTLAGLVLEGAFTSITDVGVKAYPWLPVRLLSRFKYDSLGKLINLKLPILFIHSPEDEMVPFSHSETLFQTYTGPKQFLSTSNGHNDEGFLEKQEYIDAVKLFLTTS